MSRADERGGHTSAGSWRTASSANALSRSLVECRADEPPPLPENAKLKVIGKPLPRLDAVQKVTGKARYTFDVQLPGMLYARRVVSSVPHARVVAIDTSAAEKYPGVRAVHVLDRQLQSAQLRDPNVEAKARYPVVRYLGQPLAAVAADSAARRR